MSPDRLPPDPDAEAKWRDLPQTPPSPEAMPPASGGTRWLIALLLVFGGLSILVWIVQLLTG